MKKIKVEIEISLFEADEILSLCRKNPNVKSLKKIMRQIASESEKQAAAAAEIAGIIRDGL